jgi:hypothetical protein
MKLRLHGTPPNAQPLPNGCAASRACMSETRVAPIRTAPVSWSASTSPSTSTPPATGSPPPAGEGGSGERLLRVPG